MAKKKDEKLDVSDEELDVRSVEADEIDESEDEGGIFDEEDEEDEGIFDEDLESDEEGDLEIGSTTLSTGPAVQSWGGHGLERTLNKDWAERDWKNSSGGFYENGGSGGFYENKDSDNFYRNSSGSDLYNNSGSDLYGKSGGAYDTKSGSAYDSKGKGRMKSFDETHDSRRKERSMLDVVGGGRRLKGGDGLRKYSA